MLVNNFLSEGKLTEVPKAIFLIGIFLMPFVFWPKAIIPYEIPRVWFLQRWVELLGLLSIAKIFSLKRFNSCFTLFVFIFAFISISFLSSIFGMDFQKSFFGNYFRGDGLLTLLHFFLLFLFISFFWRPSWRKQLLYAIFFSCFLISIWVLAANFAFYFLDMKSVINFDGVIGVSFGQPNFLAGYILVSLPFSLYFIVKSKIRTEKIFFQIALAFQILALLFVFSRAAFLSLLFFALGYFLINKKISLLRFFRIMTLSLLIFLSVFTIFCFNEKSNSVVENRERIFIKGVLSLRERPLLGWGLSNFDYAFESVDWPIHLNHDVYVDKAHAYFLEILVTTGFIGFLFYITIVVFSLHLFYRFFRRHKFVFWYETLFFSFLLFLFHSQTNVISVSEELFFWMILGILNAEL